MLPNPSLTLLRSVENSESLYAGILNSLPFCESFKPTETFCTHSLLWQRVTQLNCSLKSYLLLLDLKLPLLIPFNAILEDSEHFFSICFLLGS